MARRSGAVFAVPAKPSSPSCAAVSGGSRRFFLRRVGVTAGARCWGGSYCSAVDRCGVVQFPRRVPPPRLLCTVLWRACLSACRHHGTRRCVLFATMRAVAGTAWSGLVGGGAGSCEEDVQGGGEGEAAVGPGRTVLGGRLGRPVLLRASSGHGVLRPFMGLLGARGTTWGVRARTSLPCNNASALSARAVRRRHVVRWQRGAAAVGGCQRLTFLSLPVPLPFSCSPISPPCPSLLPCLRCPGPYIVTDTLGTCAFAEEVCWRLCVWLCMGVDRRAGASDGSMAVCMCICWAP